MPPRAKVIPLSSAMGSKIVAIFVGRKRKEFNVHKELICQASKFFDDAFNGPFKEGQDGRMYMPEDDPDVFACFIDWLYRNPLPIVEDDVESPKDITKLMQDKEAKEFGPITQAEHLQEKKDAEDQKKAQDARLNDQISRLLKLYFFAERNFINELMNRTMDRIRQGLAKFDRCLGHREVKLIYTNTCQGSMLRQFCTELLVYNLANVPDKKITQLVTLQQEIPDLAKDILLECKSLATFKNEITCDWDDPEENPDPRERGAEFDVRCCFHKHDVSKGEVCHKLDAELLRAMLSDSGFGPHGHGCCCCF